MRTRLFGNGSNFEFAFCVCSFVNQLAHQVVVTKFWCNLELGILNNQGGVKLGFCRMLWTSFVFATIAPSIQAQPSLTLSDQASISLITIYPGSAAHELFGHSAIRVRDPFHRIDSLYNYGTFEFDRTFLPKFIYGKLDYMLWVSDYNLELNKYQHRLGRSVIEQHLSLSHSQRQALFDYLEYNKLEENRSYRYDFLFDNCSTRIRDLFERVLGDSIIFSDEPDPQVSFRELLDPYIEPQPFLDLGIDLALGLPTDREAISRETLFLPLYLMEAFDYARIDSAGVNKPLVARTDTVFWQESESEQTESKFTFWLTLWLLFLVSLWVTNGTSHAAATARKWFDRVLYGICGVAGFLALFLWLIALHEVTNYNWNLLWAWPTHLLILPALSRSPGWLRTYMRSYTLVLVITLIGWYFWPQEMNSGLLLVLLALVVRSAWWGWGKSFTGLRS